jgi:hypothetical protein
MGRITHLAGPSLAAAAFLALIGLPEHAYAGIVAQPVPELDSIVLFGAGAVILGAYAWARHSKR